jgi:AcrR family transcriptional regulator/nitrite reductase/ring-hydroxylating ferredoxin subunit
MAEGTLELTGASTHKRVNGEPSAVARRRRREILDSAIVAIARHGLSATTVERVAELAKISPGTIVFHFPRKTELLLATLDDVAAEFEAARKRVLDETAGRPADALRRLVHISLDPGVSAPDKVAVWYAFWGEANARKVYSQRVGACDDAYQADLVALFEDLIASGGYRGLDAEAVAVRLCRPAGRAVAGHPGEGPALRPQGRHEPGAGLSRQPVSGPFRHATQGGIAMNTFDPAHGLPTWTYTSDEMLDLEYERLILPSWQFACHVSQVKEPGAFATLDLMRDSIIVIRDREGELHAFKNVCRHRGTRLLEGHGTCRSAIVCPYHGWTYGLDGSCAPSPRRARSPASRWSASICTRSRWRSSTA